jgi:glucose-1-phosphate adenylyltransferase
MAGKVIILAGGISSRMKKPAPGLKLDPYLLKDANEKTKTMIGLGEGRRPFLDYLLYEVKKAGYDEVIIVIGEKDNSIKNYYGQKPADNEFFGLNISYALQPIPPGRTKPLGTADAVYRALVQYPSWQGHHFTILNSDDLYSAPALKRLREEKENHAMLDYDREGLLFPEERIKNFAVVIKDKENYLVDIIEKPTSAQLEKARDKNGRIGISMNAWRNYYDELFPFLEKVELHPERNEKELPTAEVNMISQSQASIKCIPWKEHIPGLTSKADILPAQEYLKKHFPPPKWG